jgi:hypothetical protein
LEIFITNSKAFCELQISVRRFRGFKLLADIESIEIADESDDSSSPIRLAEGAEEKLPEILIQAKEIEYNFISESSPFPFAGEESIPDISFDTKENSAPTWAKLTHAHAETSREAKK